MLILESIYSNIKNKIWEVFSALILGLSQLAGSAVLKSWVDILHIIYFLLFYYKLIPEFTFLLIAILIFLMSYFAT